MLNFFGMQYSGETFLCVYIRFLCLQEL